MPHPYPLASVFTGGMRRDVDRTELPGGSAYNLLDFIPDEIQAVTGGRGGWTYAGNSLSLATKIQSLSFYLDTGKVIAIDQQPKAWDVVGAVALTGTPTIPGGPPAYHRAKLIIPNNDGTTTPTKYDGTSITALAGAPAGMFAGVYKDRALLASSAANSNRIWFSAAGDPTTWDTTYGWWDTTSPLTAIAPSTNAILLFHVDSTERLRGTTPPPGSDMVLEPFAPVGCLDPFSVASWQGNIIWAASQGIYLSNGVGIVDLTEGAQMKTYWQSIMSGFTNSWQVGAGIYRDHYIVSINNGNTLVDCFCVNLQNRSMWRFTNLHGACFVNVTAGGTIGGIQPRPHAVQEKLYMGQWNAGRVAELSSLWSPSGTVKQDGDGTNPTPIVETGMFRGFDRLHRRWIESMGKQKWRWGYVDYDLRDSASDNPTSALSYCTTPTGSYTQAGLTIPKTTDVGRVRRALNPTQGGATHSQMLGLKYAVTGPYASAKLYTLEGVFEPIDIGAL